AQVLGDLHVPNDPRVLIDYRTSDDAGVYALDADCALVQTVDFFTPIVDDPFLYGQIAAANALSDVYAMGGRPLTALAIAAFPKDADRAILAGIFKGGLAKLREAGVALLGGHTVQDSEIKFGYAVTGEVRTSAIWSNAGARAGDVLILTKPLGTGIISTALKFERAPAAAVAAAAASMSTLNSAASEALHQLRAGEVHACTDITGFGLLGHGSEMAAASHCTLEIEASAVPLLPEVLRLVTDNVPGGGRTNVEYFQAGVEIRPGIDPNRLQVLFDPQTSGGLLVAVAPGGRDRAMQLLAAAQVPAVVVGRVEPQRDVRVVVR
ncbi:MAG TPA: selenide, water dikinase SelD, partial [Vicinamibacterales bacterium]|nr:selenide, water dikinase SelD [Vicinamibacterales bacterium]